MTDQNQHHDLITITIYEVDGDAPIAVIEQPIDALPDTFEIETSMYHDGEDWIVGRADPANKVDFRKSGEITLTVYRQKIVKHDPAEPILCLMPTVSADTPTFTDAYSLENVYVIHEDKWRDSEFISFSFIEQMQADLDCILDVVRNANVKGVAFERAHLRDSILDPLEDVDLKLDELKQILGVAHCYDGVAFTAYAATADNGFAFKTPQGFVVFGQCHDEKVRICCIHFLDANALTPQSVAAIDQLQKQYKLMYVNWSGLVAHYQLSALLEENAKDSTTGESGGELRNRIVSSEQ